MSTEETILTIVILAAVLLFALPIAILIKVAQVRRAVKSLDSRFQKAKQEDAARFEELKKELRRLASAPKATPTQEPAAIPATTPLPSAAKNAAQPLQLTAIPAAPPPKQPKQPKSAPDPDSLTEKTRRACERIWNWLCVGEEFRPKDVSKEYAVATTWLIRAGVIILLCGFGFFLKYSFDRNFLAPAVRVFFMLATGLALVVFGLSRPNSKYRPLLFALSGAGFVTLYLSVMAAFRLYSLLEAVSAFSLMALITAAAMLAASACNALLIAMIGCIGGFLTPVFITTGTNNYPALFLYMTLLAAGTLVAAKYRDWILLHLSTLICYILLGGAVIGKVQRGQYFAILAFLALNYCIFLLPPLLRKKGKAVGILEFILLIGNAAFFFLAAIPGALKYYPDCKLAAAVPVFAAATALGALFFLRAKHREEKHLQIFFLVVAAFALSLTVPLLFGGVWITAAWSVLAFLLVYTAVKTQTKALLYFGGALYPIALLRDFSMRNWHIAVADTSYRQLLGDHLLSFGVFLASLAAAAILLLTARAFPPAKKPNDSTDANIRVSPAGKFFAAPAILLIWLAGTYELVCFSKFFIPWYTHGIPVLWWSFCAAGFVLFSGFPAWRKLLYPGIALLILTPVWYLGSFHNTFPPQEFWQAFRYNLLTIAIYLAALLASGICLRRAVGKFADEPEYAARLRQLSRTAFLAAGVIFFLYSTHELYEGLRCGLPAFRNGGVSVWWSIFAFALLFSGIRWSVKPLRIAACVLFCACAFKIFFLDCAHLNQLWRIVVFCAIGAFMLVGAVTYIHFRALFRPENEIRKEKNS